MVETDLHRDLKTGITAQGIWLFKIPDSAMGIVKPCDFVGCLRGVHVSMEAKLHKEAEITLDTTILEPNDFKNRLHQVDHARNICASGGLGLYAMGLYQTAAPWNKIAMLVRADKVRGYPPDVLSVREAMKISAPLNWNPGVGWSIDLSSETVRSALKRP